MVDPEQSPAVGSKDRDRDNRVCAVEFNSTYIRKIDCEICSKWFRSFKLPEQRNGKYSSIGGFGSFETSRFSFDSECHRKPKQELAVLQKFADIYLEGGSSQLIKGYIVILLLSHSADVKEGRKEGRVYTARPTCSERRNLKMTSRMKCEYESDKPHEV
jgi:hypothetical protein